MGTQQMQSQRRRSLRPKSATGISRHQAASAGLDAPIARQDILQRTLGNVALGGGVSASGDGAQTRSDVVSGIVQRGMDAAASVATPVKTRTPKPLVQRLISGDSFDSKTGFWFFSGKSDAFFKQVANGLRTYEAMPQTRFTSTSPQDVKDKGTEEWKARRKQLRQVYRLCDEWVLEGNAEGSSRAEHVFSLMKELRNELSPKKGSTGPNLAGTSSGKVRKGGTNLGKNDTPAQQEAIQVIDNTTLHPDRKQHARDMIRDPDLIQQGAFGVCGLTSILYAVAKGTPKRFAELIRDAWADTQLVTTWLDVYYNNADPRHVKIRAEVEYITSQWLVRKSGFTDMKENVVTTADPNDTNSKESVQDKQKQFDDVMVKQREFSDSFEIDGWENTLGHFALTAGAVTMLLNALGTTKESYKIKRGSFGTDYAAARQKAGKGSVLASVVDVDFYQKNGAPVDVAFVKTRKPKYVHWVILKDAKLEGDHWKLSIWTWGKDFAANVHKDHIGTYVYSVVAAQSEQ